MLQSGFASVFLEKWYFKNYGQNSKTTTALEPSMNSSREDNLLIRSGLDQEVTLSKCKDNSWCQVLRAMLR